jgi:predicted DNA-binding transcriptional regulator AlpA
MKIFPDATMPRRALSHVEAARYVGIGTTKFDEMIKDGRMPRPVPIDGRVLWDIRDLDAAWENLKAGASANAWDHVA